MTRFRFRASVAVAAVIAASLVSGVTRVAIAASPVTGTIACSVEGLDSEHNLAIMFRPYLGSQPRPVRIFIRDQPPGSCDDSAVTSTRPIVGVKLKFAGRLPDGTCAELTSAPAFSNGKVKLQWLTDSPPTRVVAVSKAKLASATFDEPSNALVLTTEPISVGAFAGEIATLHLGVSSDVATLDSQCQHAQFVGWAFGGPHAATVEVQ